MCRRGRKGASRRRFEGLEDRYRRACWSRELEEDRQAVAVAVAVVPIEDWDHLVENA